MRLSSLTEITEEIRKKMLIKNEMNSTIPPIYFPESMLPLSSGTGKVPVARSLGTLRNYDGDGKGNKQKKTTLHAFLYISLPSLQQLRREMTNFELSGERERQGDTFCSLWTRTRSPLFSSHLTSLLSSNWVTWYKREKVSPTFSLALPLSDRKVLFLHWRRKRECIKGNRRRLHAAYPADPWNENVFPPFLRVRHKF